MTVFDLGGSGAVRWYNAGHSFGPEVAKITNDEMQRAMDFIGETQAQTAMKIGALTESQSRNAEGIQARLALAQIHEREIETVGHQIASVSRDVGALSRDIGVLGETTRATD